MDNGNKSTQKVLTTDEIRKLAGNWSLAGDVGLLAHLEQLSESIFNRTKETQKHFDELIDEYEDAYAKVGNITNQFLALQNCQFVENRVYDEETPTEEKAQVKVQDEAEQERLLLLQYKEAVEIGVKLLDTHFQEVQLPPNSDSDEEDEVSEGNSIIWKPKNPYAGKKFPLLIGSAEWWADDHVGLRTNEENLETEKIVSESESDFESLKSTDKKLKSSSSSASSMENLKPVTSKPFLESSSEDLFGLDKTDKVSNSDEFFSKGNSLLEEPISFLPDLENGPEIDPAPKNEPPKIEATQEEEEEAKNPKKVDNAFTRELMAKLSNVTTKKENGFEEKQREPPPRKVKPEESLFDETDDSGDLFSAKVDSVPVGEKGLFFDVENDDQLFNGSKDLFSGSSLFVNEAEKPETQPVTKKTVEPIVKDTKEVKESKKETIAPKKNFVEDLFEDLDDDETLFATKLPEKSIFTSSQPEPKKSLLIAPDLIWDNDEGLFDSINNVIDDDFLSPSPFLESQTKINPETKNAEESKSKEADDIFESETIGNDPFGFASSEKVEELEDDLFLTGVKSSSKVDDDSSLFGDKPKQPDATSISSSRSSLFDDANGSKTRLASVFEKEAAKGEDLFNANDSVKPMKKSLFDEECDDGDDLFGEKSLFENKNEGGGLFNASSKIKETKMEMTKEKLFNDVDDGELFAGKSDRKLTPPSSLTLPGKSVGKLTIPQNLKGRLESTVKHISPGGVKPPLKEETPKDEPFEPSNLLKCPNKDRVKIPGRRRPQSRRARQEAIRNSGIWEEPRSPPVSSPNPLSPSTDEEDFFKVPELDTNFEKEDQSIFKSDLFESKQEDGLLFDGAPVLSPKKVETKTASLFDDDDENLFNAPSKPAKMAEVKKSLFEADLDEDDDLFGGKTHATPSKPPFVSKPKEYETKEKGNSSFVDPLGLMSTDD